MIKSPTLLIGILLLCVCFACDKSVEKKTPGGMKFTLVKPGDGVLPKTGQSVVMDYVIKDSKDSVWNDSYDIGFPALVPVEDTMNLKTEIGILQVARMCSRADSLTLTLPVKKFFKEVFGGEAPPKLDTTIMMTCTMHVKDIIETYKSQQYFNDLQVARTPRQKIKDIKKIDDYLAKKGIKAEQDTTGLRYVIHTRNNGAKPTAQGCAVASYQGLLLDGEKVFDQSSNFNFPLSRVIPGWTIGFQKLGVGDSATFYIPSGLGYGFRGNGPVLPDANLIFHVKLIGVGENFDYQTRTCN